MKAGSPPVVDDDTKVIFDNVSHIFLELMTFVDYQWEDVHGIPHEHKEYIGIRVKA